MFEVQRSTKEGDVRVTTAFNRMLGLPARGQDVAFGAEAVIVTSCCGREACLLGLRARGLPIKEHREKRWRSLDLGAPRCVIECRLRRLYCPGCGDVYEGCRGRERALDTRAISRISRRGWRSR